ncbi:unnamed protein product [Rotaria socialis]|uniref:Uncharacterized protein n=1 Tax=Rotaria socialis TaxID=392032 RepID=A0A821T1Z2_9BILA|nr:unnamed protein product [Rotaria socialis]
MSKSTCHSRLSSTATTPDLDVNNIELQNLIDFRNQTNTNDKRFNNINYVRHVLRKVFGSHSELLLDWLLIHFENRYEDIPLIKQVILQCCTCLIGLGVLRIEENNSDSELFQVRKEFLLRLGREENSENFCFLN